MHRWSISLGGWLTVGVMRDEWILGCGYFVAKKVNCYIRLEEIYSTEEIIADMSVACNLS